jgi:hypothetical protein
VAWASATRRAIVWAVHRRRALIAALVAPLLLAAGAAHAATAPTEPDPPPALTFTHDGTRDGTPSEIHSGFYPGDDGDDANGDALADRHPNTYETYEVDVPEGSRHGSLTAQIAWSDARIDLDLSVYRLDADGHTQGAALARGVTSAKVHRASETASYAPGVPIAPGRYLVVVDNVCSRDADDDPRTADPNDHADCGIGEDVPDEDDFHGTVNLGNELPAVTLSGPASGIVGDAISFHAEASDRDGQVTGYFFDLDGDGVYETDSDGNADVSATYPSTGTRTIGVQVTDNSGNVAYATHTLKVTKRPASKKTLLPVVKFRLSTHSFGGPAGRRLVVTYRLRERARVSMSLRHGGRTVRRIAAGVRARRRDYKVVLEPAHLARGAYTVTLRVAGASGRVQVVQLSARRR